MTRPLLFDPRPIFTIDYKDISDMSRDVIYLSISETTEGLKNMEAKFTATGPAAGSDSEDLLYVDGRTADFGKNIKVTLGPEALQRFVFDGFISAIELQFDEGQVPEFGLFAEDKAMDLRMTKKSRTFADQSDEDIARAIAEEHGMSAEVDAPGPTFAQIQQCNMSDLAFLRDRARLLQAEIWIDGNTLHFVTRANRIGTEITLIRGTDLLHVKLIADLAHQRSKVRMGGYNATTTEMIEEEAGEEAIRSEIVGGKTGVSVLENAFGERICKRVMEVPLDENEARTWAAAEMQRRARSFVTINAIANGNPDLVVGSLVKLEQVGQPFEGEGYYVTQVQHIYTLANGHKTHFQAQRATIN